MRKIVIVLIILFQLIGLILSISNKFYIIGLLILLISNIVSILLIFRKRECGCDSRYEDPSTNQWVCIKCGRRYLSNNSIKKK